MTSTPAKQQKLKQAKNLTAKDREEAMAYIRKQYRNTLDHSELQEIVRLNRRTA